MKAIKIHADSTEGKTLIERFNIFGFPTIVIVDSTGNEIDRIIGYREPKEFKSELVRIKVGKNTLDYYKRKTIETPNDYNQWESLAEKYEERGDLHSAVEVWESVDELEIGNRSLIEYKLIELYAHLNNDIVQLKKYVTDHLDSEYTQYGFRNIINILRKNKNAIDEIDTWIDFVHYMELKQLNTPSFYNSFAWRMSELDQNLEMALEKIQKGWKDVPLSDSSTIAGFRDTEAEVLWKMGNTEEALKVINECIALQPDDNYFKDQKDKFLK